MADGSTYTVFVEGPTSSAPDATARLAAAMGEHYGLAARDLEPRLRAGRFRVKTNVDRDTAERYAIDLERLGALVSVVDAGGTPIARGKLPAAAPAPAPLPPVRPERAAAGGESKGAKPPPPSFSSGLSAAFGARSDDPDLGALGSDAGLALSALDGSDEHAPAEGSFGPPPSSSAAALPASIGPAIAKPAAPAPPAQQPIDMFAPPDEEAPLDLAVDTAPAKRATVASVPPPVAATMAPPPAAAQPAAAPSKGAREYLRAFAGKPRARFATGALLAVLLGFAPAAILASVREHSAFAAVDRDLVAAQQQATTPEAYGRLDQLRDAAEDEKVADKHSIALVSVLVWAAVSAGVAFVWYRKIDWDRLAA